MAPRKRPRKYICAQAPASEIATVSTLPTDLFLKIVAHTDLFTLVRCAAVCKYLRRNILSSSFIRHVTREVAPCILADVSTYDEWRLTLVHPITPTASSFCHDHLSSFMSRRTANLLGQYTPVTTRGGLIVLCHEHTKTRRRLKHRLDLCVYNPMTGRTTFLLKSPYGRIGITTFHKYVLLTAADGIDSSFMLLFIDLKLSRSITVHTTTSSSGTWETITTYNNNPDSPWWSVHDYSYPTVLHNGVVHWLVDQSKQILTYDVRMKMSGLMKLPPTNLNANQLHLATSLDGNKLKLLTIDGFMMSMWLHLPTVPSNGSDGGWVLETMVDIEEKFRSLCPNLFVGDGPDVLVEFKASGKRSGNMVLLEVPNQDCVLLDMETMEMHGKEWGSCDTLLEIDLPSHLQTMKVFS